MGPQMANVHPAGSTGLGYERATVPTSSPVAPLPPRPATTIWITASTTTARPRVRSVEAERRVVTGMAPLSCRTTGRGHSTFRSPEWLLQKQDVEPPAGHHHAADDHHQEVAEVAEHAEVDHPGGQAAHQFDGVEERQGLDDELQPPRIDRERVEGGGEQEHRQDRQRDEVEVLPRAHVGGGG